MLLAHETTYCDWFFVKISTRVELKGNRFASFIHSECDSSFSNAARVFRPTIVVVMNAARVINFDPVNILRYLNRGSGNDDHMSSVPECLVKLLGERVNLLDCLGSTESFCWAKAGAAKLIASPARVIINCIFIFSSGGLA